MTVELAPVVSRMPMAIRELPVSERPRERLTALGASALSSAELLAVLLGNGSSQGGSALHLGHQHLGRNVAKVPRGGAM